MEKEKGNTEKEKRGKGKGPLYREKMLKEKGKTEKEKWVKGNKMRKDGKGSRKKRRG